MPIQYILAPVCIAALAAVWILFRKGKVGVRAAWAWSTVWTLGLAIVLFPDLASVLASSVGVGRGADLVLYLAVILIFYLVFRIFLRLDRMEREITSLVRHHSMEEARRKDGRPTIDPSAIDLPHRTED